ncbi:hypothetical protein TNCV_4362391 [Trichonephila clavipes]|nr:hypothetical protein TNCV_4362391 [Trichonephila clavipes]
MMDRISICETLSKRNEIGPFLKRMVTGDEKWITYDNIVRKRSWSKSSEAAHSVARTNGQEGCHQFLVGIQEHSTASENGSPKTTSIRTSVHETICRRLPRGIFQNVKNSLQRRCLTCQKFALGGLLAVGRVWSTLLIIKDHVVRTDVERTTEKVFNVQLIGIRRKCRPNLKWIHDLEKDLLVLKTKNLGEHKKERLSWKRLLDKAKATWGCQPTEEGYGKILKGEKILLLYKFWERARRVG